MTTTTIAPVARTVTVGTSPERAFAIFTDRIGAWWPLAMYSIGGARADVAFVDGQLLETAADGNTTAWGEVTEWDPPRRVAFSWAPGGGPATAIEVDFEAGDG